MNRAKLAGTLGLIVLLSAGVATAAVDEPNYRVVKNTGGIEIREYDSYLVAEIEVKGSFDAAAFQAFDPLFKFIDGNNRSKQKIEMTSPVEQQASGQQIPMTAPVTQRSGESIPMTAPVTQRTGEEIPMTAPVTQTKGAGTYAVGFVMPDNLNLENVPEPLDPRIKIREVPTRTVAVITYSGSWSHLKYARMEKKLLEEVKKQGLTPVGAPVFARYNHPGIAMWDRRNEIMVEVK